jgi:hypothetical protein
MTSDLLSRTKVICLTCLTCLTCLVVYTLQITVLHSFASKQPAQWIYCQNQKYDPNTKYELGRFDMNLTVMISCL